MIKSIEDVINLNMCTGCGFCADAQGMAIDDKGYSRPINFIDTQENRSVCPGISVENYNNKSHYNIKWGRIISCETSNSTDNEIRRISSSGGTITSILKFLIENKIVDEVIQVGVDNKNPIKNSTYRHGNTSALLNNAGSRYSPSSPLENIKEILGNGKKYAFVGKPCDVSALRSFAKINKAASDQIILMISFMCAGIPSEHATIDIIEKFNEKTDNIKSFRYRGNGWPGLTEIITKSNERHTLTYNESWGTILNKKLQPRCKICADGIGESADIVCGDAWHESKDGYPSFEEKDGRSLLITRTKIGKDICNAAQKNNFIACDGFPVELLDKIQPYQLTRKKTSLSRSFALIFTLKKSTRFTGYHIFELALSAGLKVNLKTFLGTVKRRLLGRI